MKRYVKVLATVTVLGTQVSPGAISAAGAQVTATLGPVSISGKSSGGGNTGCHPNCAVPGSGYTSGGGASPAPSFPESEAHTKPVILTPAPPPKKSDEQRLKDLKDCQDQRANRIKTIESTFDTAKQQCVASASSWEYAAFDWVLSKFGKDCISRAESVNSTSLVQSNEMNSVCVARAMEN